MVWNLLVSSNKNLQFIFFDGLQFLVDILVRLTKIAPYFKDPKICFYKISKTKLILSIHPSIKKTSSTETTAFSFLFGPFACINRELVAQSFAGNIVPSIFPRLFPQDPH